MVAMSDVRCYEPYDIEVTAERASMALRAGRSASFTTQVDDEELLVLAHEVSLETWPVDVARVTDAIRASVAAEHGIPVYAIVLLPPHSLPSTPDGTIRRDLCAQMYRTGQLPELSRSMLDDPGATGTFRLQHATWTDPDVSSTDMRKITPFAPHGRTSRWYRWVCGSRSPIVNVLDRETCFPHLLTPQAPARHVTVPATHG
jgi:hypothetical protein